MPALHTKAFPNATAEWSKHKISSLGGDDNWTSTQQSGNNKKKYSIFLIPAAQLRRGNLAEDRHKD